MKPASSALKGILIRDNVVKYLLWAKPCPIKLIPLDDKLELNNIEVIEGGKLVIIVAN